MDELLERWSSRNLSELGVLYRVREEEAIEAANDAKAEAGTRRAKSRPMPGGRQPERIDPKTIPMPDLPELKPQIQ